MDVGQVSKEFSLAMLIGLSVLGIFALMFVFLWVGWFFTKKRYVCPCPYSGLPLRKATDISYTSMVKVAKFLTEFPGYDNQIFKFYWASLSRETGRIFPSSVTWYGKIKVDWNFLQKRLPGHYVSWGSLSLDQQRVIREVHGTLEGFQTEFSSPNPAPSHIEHQYAFTKPGPLYVDLETKILLGWQCVPHSNLEVLIVKKPLQSIALPQY